MIRKLRESKWLYKSDVANILVDVKDPAMYGGFALFAAFSVMMSMLIIGLPLSYMIGDGLGVLIAVAFGVLFTVVLNNLGRLSVRRGLTGTYYIQESRNGFTWPSYHNKDDALDAYLSLSADERAEYPRDFIATLRNTDIPDEQMGVILHEADQLYENILERREVKRTVTRRVVDASDTIEQLQRARQGVLSDTDVYKELA